MSRPEGTAEAALPSGLGRSGAERGRSAGPEVVIRRMRHEDVAAVVEIERRSFSQPWEERTFRRLLETDRARAWTARADRVVGYAVLWAAGRGAQLGNLAVAPDARRRGIGRRLVRTALKAARSFGAERLTLEVRESNRAARSLYRDLGFRLAGRRGDYYRCPREDALVLAADTR